MFPSQWPSNEARRHADSKPQSLVKVPQHMAIHPIVIDIGESEGILNYLQTANVLAA